VRARPFTRLLPLLVLALGLLVACAPPAGQSAGPSAAASVPVQKKRVVVGLQQGMTAVSVKAAGNADKIEYLIHAGLAQIDPRTVLHPQLAEAVPSVENGLWKLLPGGRMETTWKIRSDARWHDGEPITSGDFVFAAQIDQDRELAIAADAGWPLVESVTAPDAATVVIMWKQPYTLADSMFGSPNRVLPRHLLEAPYQQDKSRFLGLPFWNESYVGAGPYKLREFLADSHIIFDAFDGYLLGRPKVDEVELRLITDNSTLVANLLAGAVDFTIGRNIAPDQAAQIEGFWTSGQVVVGRPLSDNFGMFPQQLNPSLPLLKDARFRKALLHLLDREEMNDTIMGGRSAVSHTHLTPAIPDYDVIQDSVVKYAFDPRAAGQLLEELGYSRSGAGLWEDAAGQRIGFEFRAAGSSSEQQRSMLAGTEYWKAGGLDVTSYVAPSSLERAQVAEFPGILVSSAGGDASALYRYMHSSFAPVAENRYVGNNKARYMLPELDGLLDRWFTTIPQGERTQALRALMRYESENVTWMGLLYSPQLSLIGNRVRNVSPSSYAAKTYNAHLWDVVA
jgi:peptide/nickel transport system substrate-binding protein